MRFLVTGKGGQLASEFEVIHGDNPNWTFVSIENFDITNKTQMLKFIGFNQYDYVINCAAYTQVDDSEDNVELAFKVNDIGVLNLIEICKLMNSKLIHFSTDYVFNGDSDNPYTEVDNTNPVGVYAKSKLSGEQRILNSHILSIIIRTSWVYSTFGKNFVKTMLDLANRRQSIGVVHDQIGSPTYAQDLAGAVLKIINDSNYVWKVGDLFNFSNEGECSWFDFASEIFKLSNKNINIYKLETEDYPTKAFRPNYTYLDKEKIKSQFNLEINHWKISLNNMLNKLLS